MVTSSCTVADQLTRGRPMWCVPGLKALLDLNEDQVMALIDEGKLLWAFDLSLQPKRALRHAIRVLPKSVDEFRAGQSSCMEWDTVASLVKPHDKLFLTSLEIQRTCNVSSAHVAALIRHKLLAAVSAARTGPNGSARIIASSFIQFLKSRVYP